jgi:hypothetical protein
MVRAYLDEIDALTAEESLMWAERLAVGTGAAGTGQARAALARWRRAASREPGTQPAPSPTVLAASGIRVIPERRRKA